jgi:hypothetical protein
LKFKEFHNVLPLMFPIMIVAKYTGRVRATTSHQTKMTMFSHSFFIHVLIVQPLTQTSQEFCLPVKQSEKILSGYGGHLIFIDFPP